MLKIIWNTVKTYLTVRKSVPMKLFWGVLFTASCSVYTHTCSAAVIYWKLHKHASCLVGFQRDSHTTKVAKEFWSHCLGHFYCEWWRFTMLSIIIHNLPVCDQPKRMWEHAEKWGHLSYLLGVFKHGTNPPQKNKTKTNLSTLSCQQAAPNSEAARCEQIWFLWHTQATNNKARVQLCCHVYAEGQLKN